MRSRPKAGIAGDLHDQAMRLCGLAIASEGLGRRAAYRRAHRLEVEAARLTEAEPSRGILWRSAAWLALDAGKPAGAAWAAQRGLDSPGDLPKRYRRELVEVLRVALERLQRLASINPRDLGVQLRRSGWLRDDRSVMPLTTTPAPGSGRGTR